MPFTLCDAPGYSANCVVDGDTFRMAERRIRIEGIDAPEREGQCEEESRASLRATQALNDWLNQGDFHMLAADDVPRDQYGRELQTIWRETPQTRRQDLAAHLIDSGFAEVYSRNGRPDWCR